MFHGTATCCDVGAASCTFRLWADVTAPGGEVRLLARSPSRTAVELAHATPRISQLFLPVTLFGNLRPKLYDCTAGS